LHGGGAAVYPYVESRTLTGGRTVVTTGGDGQTFSGITDVGVSFLQHGAPSIQLAQIPDASLPPEKFTDPPASQQGLDDASVAFQASLDGVEADQATLTSDLAAHVGATADVHGCIGAPESATGAAAKVAAHAADAGAHAALVAGMQLASEKDQMDGYCGLTNTGKIDPVRLPPIGLKAVQRGTTTMRDEGNSDFQQIDSAAFTAVDVNKSFILLSVCGGAGATVLAQYQVTAEFEGTTKLRFKRDNGNGVVYVVWQVVEMH
jgi:hypothetical protein